MLSSVVIQHPHRMSRLVRYSHLPHHYPSSPAPSRIERTKQPDHSGGDPSMWQQRRSEPLRKKYQKSEEIPSFSRGRAGKVPFRLRRL